MKKIHTRYVYLMKGKGLPIAEEMLSVYIPSLSVLIQQSSSDLPTLAGLATQAKILQAVLAMHRLNFIAREMYCREAVEYGKLSEDDRLHAGALMYPVPSTGDITQEKGRA